MRKIFFRKLVKYFRILNNTSSWSDRKYIEYLVNLSEELEVFTSQPEVENDIPLPTFPTFMNDLSIQFWSYRNLFICSNQDDKISNILTELSEQFGLNSNGIKNIFFPDLKYNFADQDIKEIYNLSSLEPEPDSSFASMYHNSNLVLLHIRKGKVIQCININDEARNMPNSW
jgi:hypothetical protein